MPSFELVFAANHAASPAVTNQSDVPELAPAERVDGGWLIGDENGWLTEELVDASLLHNIHSSDLL